MGIKKESVCLQDGGGCLILVEGSKYLFLCGFVFLNQELCFLSSYIHIHGHVQVSCISVAGGGLALPLHDIYSEGISFVSLPLLLLRIFSVQSIPLQISQELTTRKNPPLYELMNVKEMDFVHRKGLFNAITVSAAFELNLRSLSQMLQTSFLSTFLYIY